MVGLRPVPVDKLTKEPIWDGTQGELFVADAMAECSYAMSTKNSIVTIPLYYDDYLLKVKNHMNAALCSGGMSWVEQRNDAECNGEATNPQIPAAMSLQPIAQPQNIYNFPAPSIPPAWDTYNNSVLANTALAQPGALLCLAQKLRSVVPGNSNGESLFLKKSEQLQFLITAQRVAQRSVFEYSRLGLLFFSPQEWVPSANTSLKYRQWVPILQAWARDGSTKAWLGEMADDFAAALQLYLFYTDRLAEVLVRNANANTPRGGQPTSIPDEHFGPGSWRQRLNNFLYGGAPFGQEEDGPWQHPLNVHGAANPIWGYSTAWPTRLETPFVEEDAAAPEIATLEALAHSCDELKFARMRGQASDGPASGGGEQTNWVIYPSGTGNRLYRAVERHVRNQDCVELTDPNDGNSCRTFTMEEIPEPGEDLSDFSLFKKHGITPQHARALVRYMAEELGPMAMGSPSRDGMGVAFDGELAWTDIVAEDYVQSPPATGCSKLTDCCNSIADPMERQNCLDWAAYLEATFPQPEADDKCNQAIQVTQGYEPSFCPDFVDPTWLHVKQGTTLHPPARSQVVPLYQRYAALVRVPERVWSQVDTYYQQVDSYSASKATTVRLHMGAVATLNAVRQMLLSARAFRDNIDNEPNTAPSSTGAYLENLDAMLDVVGGAVGGDSVLLRQSVFKDSKYDPPRVKPGVEAGGTEHIWNVDVVIPKDDPWWQIPEGAPSNWGASFEILAVFNKPNLGNLARFSKSNYFGETIEDYLVGVPATPLDLRQEVDELKTPLRHLNGFALLYSEPDPLATHDYWTFLVRKKMPGEESEYRVLADGMEFEPKDHPYAPADVTYSHSEGGTFGQLQSEVWSQKPNDKSKPQYDAFGLPTDLVLPTNPNLYVGTGAEDPMAHYLLRGKQAADEATQAVVTAMNTLIEQEIDATKAAAEKVHAEELLQLQKEELCGPGVTDCDLKLVRGPVFDPSVLPPLSGDNGQCPTGSPPQWPNPTSNQKKLWCNAFWMLRKLSGWQLPGVDGADTVKEGGSLYVALTDLSAAKARIKLALDDLLRSFDGAIKAVDLADAQLASAEKQVELVCGGEAVAEAVGQGFGISVGASLGISFSPGALIAQKQACDQATTQLPVEQKNHVLALWEAWDKVAAHGSVLADRMISAEQAGAIVAKAIQEAELAEKRLELELELVDRSRLTSSGLYRRYHQYDLYRAQALMASARRYGVLARRAIEAHYVVDLSGMADDEPLVLAPRAWADSIYSDDINMPAAVGLSVATPAEEGIYPNQLVDYMDNLQRFIDGFPIKRPAALANNDSEVLTLPGPTQTLGQVLDPKVYMWGYFCGVGEDGQWVQLPQSGDPNTACQGGPPTRARLVFTLDPHGELSTSNYDKRFNARWQRLAVNLVGTGIRDCALAADPLTCYASPYLRYDLKHTGPSLVPNYYGDLRLLYVPSAYVEGGKALAAEQWLDPVSNGWAQSFVTQVARSELKGRPFNGVYELNLEVTPDVKLEHIERVQVLVDSSYWVHEG